MKNAWKYLGLLLMGFGLILVFGLISIFPSSTTCIGLFLFNQCFGYYSTMTNGSNFIAGIALTGVGAIIFLFKGGLRR